MQDACEENFNVATFKFRTNGVCEQQAISFIYGVLMVAVTRVVAQQFCVTKSE